MTSRELKDRMVNGTPSRFWCPMCQQEREKLGFLVPWLSPRGVLVCVYGACEECGKVMHDAPERLRSTIADRIEQNILNKYPGLWNKLPNGYSPMPTE
jgi:hypothetical protein